MKAFLRKTVPILLAVFLVSIGGISLYKYISADLVASPISVLWFIPAIIILQPCYNYWTDTFKNLFNFSEKTEKDFGEQN